MKRVLRMCAAIMAAALSSLSAPAGVWAQAVANGGAAPCAVQTVAPMAGAAPLAAQLGGAGALAAQPLVPGLGISLPSPGIRRQPVSLLPLAAPAAEASLATPSRPSPAPVAHPAVPVQAAAPALDAHAVPAAAAAAHGLAAPRAKAPRRELEPAARALTPGTRPSEKGGALQAAASLRSVHGSRLGAVLPAFFDRSAPRAQGTEPVLAEACRPRVPRLRPAAAMGEDTAPAPPADPEAARKETAEFLSRVGFKDHSASITENLKDPGLSEFQRKVLEHNAKRYEVFNAARGLASEVMAGMAEQGYSPEAMSRCAELAARLLGLQPIAPPATLPAHVAGKDKDAIRETIIAVVMQRFSFHLAQVVSDVTATAVPERVRAAALRGLREGGGQDPAAREFLARVRRTRDQAERLLVAAYTDAEMGQTRYAGRALAAALVRFARRYGRPEVEEALRMAVSARGQLLENFVGDTIAAPDASSPGGLKRIQVRTGDFLAGRSRGREAAVLTFAVRPPLGLWLKAWRSKLFGSPLALLVNRGSVPAVAPGSGFLGVLKATFYRVMAWVAQAPFLNRGYSHLGMALVEEADGVSMAWALDNYPNVGEGGIRQIGILEEFAQLGFYMRLGVARLDAAQVWDAYHRQAEAGYRGTVYDSKDGKWPAAISPEEFRALAAIPRAQAARLLDELNRRAARTLEAMLTRYGVGFNYDFTTDLWRAYCSSTMVLAHLMGSLFEVQDRPDRWHPLVLALKALGVSEAKDQDTDGRIIWPASLMIDPKVAVYETAEFPPFRAVGRIEDPYTVPAYLEMDRALTMDLLSFVYRTGFSIVPDPDVIGTALRTYLDTRTDKRRAKHGGHPRAGISAGLEDLLEGR